MKFINQSFSATAAGLLITVHNFVLICPVVVVFRLYTFNCKMLTCQKKSVPRSHTNTHTHTQSLLYFFLFSSLIHEDHFHPLFLITQQAHIKMFVLVMAIFCTRSFFSIFMKAQKYFFTNTQGSFHTDCPFIVDFALPQMNVEDARTHAVA